MAGDRTEFTARQKQIAERARGLGFDAVGFASAAQQPEIAERLQQFLSANYHGEMDWLNERSHQRSAPQNLWSQAISVVTVAMNYGPATNPLDDLQHRNFGAISAYARGRDYHDFIKKQLRILARWISESLQVEVKIFVDTAPVMEKPLAQLGGLGWQGKHSNLVSRDHGSWLLLAEIFVASDLGETEAETDHCGGCNRCITICPTAAIVAPYRLDARRCISYLTIEYKGVIPREFRSAIGNRIYGCDDCLAVCPWNKFARVTGHLEFNSDYRMENLGGFLTLDDANFRQKFSGSPIKRIGRDRFIRNVLIAVGNSGEPSFMPLVLPLLCDDSPLVRGMAVWAARNYLVPVEMSKLRQNLPQPETDDSVIEEWNLAIGD
ncbi:MAG: tRNA epoxyqueuosine(34) reductase QueG [Candidatus Pacebacteria bacterium]|nr:tRNA epoxyqueuosine(34) reductase QueG [Candidatus Paceibacterota bacterium]